MLRRCKCRKRRASRRFINRLRKATLVPKCPIVCNKLSKMKNAILRESMSKSSLSSQWSTKSKLAPSSRNFRTNFRRNWTRRRVRTQWQPRSHLNLKTPSRSHSSAPMSTRVPRKVSCKLPLVGTSLKKSLRISPSQPGRDPQLVVPLSNSHPPPSLMSCSSSADARNLKPKKLSKSAKIKKMLTVKLGKPR